MSQSDTFIKDVMNYFFTLRGKEKGLMISPKDSYLIMEWHSRGLSKEQVIKGIRDAFEQIPKRNIRSIYDCREQVENSEAEPGEPAIEPMLERTGSLEVKLYIKALSDSFSRLIKKETSSALKDLHSEYKERLLMLDTSEKSVFEKVNEIEEEYFGRIPGCLDDARRVDLKDETSRFLNSRSDYINERSKEKLLNTWLKNLIIEKYISFNPFEVDKQ